MSSESEKIKSIVVRVQRGDKNAVRELIFLFEKPLFKFCYHLSFNREVAEDVSQAAFLKCFKSIKNFNPNKSFKSFLFQIANNSFIDYIRRQKNTKQLAEPDEEISNAQSGNPDYNNLISFVFSKMTEDEKSILILIDLEEHPYDEVGKILNISVANVTVKIYRAREKFIKILRENNIEITGIFKIPGGSDVA